VDRGTSPTAPPLHIALVCPYSLSRPGGVQGQVIGLARALGARGHRATVFAPLDAPKDAPEGVDLVVTGRSVSLPANGSIAPVTVSPTAVVHARRVVQSGGFDVVHVHEPFAPGLPYGLLVGRGLPPLVATFHRSGSSVLYTVLGPVARRLARHFAIRVAVSEAARVTASEALGGTYEAGFNGVEVERYRGVRPWPVEGPTVLFLGRHEERKGLRTLLAAFEELRSPPSHLPLSDVRQPAGRSAGPVLWIAGDGPQTDALRRLHPESSDIRWLGVLPEDEKIRRLVAADILCAPALGGESFGMVLVEAMAAQTVVVASDIDGYRQAVGGWAVMVPPGDAGALAKALSGVLSGELAVTSANLDRAGGGGSDESSRRSWLAAGLARAEERSMARLADWYEGLYRSAMVGAQP
jgi:phosphatidyl-myo-inositol alpha-mannosyltransferase